MIQHATRRAVMALACAILREILAGEIDEENVGTVYEAITGAAKLMGLAHTSTTKASAIRAFCDQIPPAHLLYTTAGGDLPEWAPARDALDAEIEAATGAVDGAVAVGRAWADEVAAALPHKPRGEWRGSTAAALVQLSRAKQAPSLDDTIALVCTGAASARWAELVRAAGEPRQGQLLRCEWGSQGPPQCPEDATQRCERTGLVACAEHAAVMGGGPWLPIGTKAS